MGKMKDLAFDLAERWQDNHPGSTWEEAMEAVCTKIYEGRSKKGDDQNEDAEN